MVPRRQRTIARPVAQACTNIVGRVSRHNPLNPVIGLEQSLELTVRLAGAAPPDSATLVCISGYISGITRSLFGVQTGLCVIAILDIVCPIEIHPCRRMWLRRQIRRVRCR